MDYVLRMTPREQILLAVAKGYKVLANGSVINGVGLIVNAYAKNNPSNKKRGNFVTGRLCFTIYEGQRPDRKKYQIFVHRLQAYQKFGEAMFMDGIEVRHKDNNHLNNGEDNILLGTKSENMMDLPEEFRIKRAKRAASFLRALTDDQVREIRRLSAAGVTYNTLVEQFGVAKGTISYVVNRRMYADVV